MLLQLVYYSRFVPGDQGAMSTVSNILEVSEANNGRNRITGFLIFDKANFLQILEGDPADVEQTYQRIALDSRHENIAVIERREVSGRAFADWAMGGYVRTPETRHIYARHGLQDTIDPQTLRANQVVALALDVLAFESERQSSRGLSARR